MKTMNLILASLVLSFVFVSCQKEDIEPALANDGANLKAVPANPSAVSATTRMVFYEVKITVVTEKPICNVYWVELTDANGMNVAPKQVFVPGTSSYFFKEQIRMRSGIRIAKLVLSPGMNIRCETEWFTEPDKKMIQFKENEKYNFALYPQGNPKKGM
jgi:hypothetical protein